MVDAVQVTVEGLPSRNPHGQGDDYDDAAYLQAVEGFQQAVIRLWNAGVVPDYLAELYEESLALAVSD